MNTEELKTLLIDTLTKMASTEYEPKYPNVGICGNLERGLLTLDAHSLVRELSKGWDKHSGEGGWPIPARPHLDPINTYFECKATGSLWEGKQRELRQDLCRYLVERVRGLSTEEMEAFMLTKEG